MAEPVRKNSSETEPEHDRGYDRKQKWKALPGNRYTAAELREIAESLGPLRITEQEPHIMRLD